MCVTLKYTVIGIITHEQRFTVYKIRELQWAGILETDHPKPPFSAENM